jgi:alpha-galactosidase
MHRDLTVKTGKAAKGGRGGAALASLALALGSFSAALAQSKITVRTVAAGPLVIGTGAAEFRITSSGYIQPWLVTENGLRTLDEPGDTVTGGSYAVSGGTRMASFSLDLGRARIRDTRSSIGQRGKRIEITGQGSGDSAGLRQSVLLEAYDEFPSLLFASVTYTNTGSAEMKLDEVVVQRHRVNGSPAGAQTAANALWSFQGAAYRWGVDEVFRMPEKFDQPNVMGGPGARGLGGGIPVVDFWNGTMGMAIAHAEPVPTMLWMPVRVHPDQRVEASIVLKPAVALKPGASYSSPRTLVAVHAGDFYDPLSLWSRVLQRQDRNWSMTRPTESSYAPNWCGWGYGADFTPAQMRGTIPKLQDLGFRWATLDYVWFETYGDYDPRKDTFPGGEIRKLADDFHKKDIRITLWWMPLLVEDGGGRHLNSKKMPQARIVGEHPEWLILDPEGRRARLVSPVSTGASMCPAVPAVVEYHRKLVRRFLEEWDYDGHKMDSVFTVPPCYNPAHGHKSPEDSVRAVAGLYKAIVDTTRAIKPYAVTQICPCGTPPAMAWVPYQDQAVTGDPVSSEQVRRRIKMYKAIMGPRAAVYGDHVELSGPRRKPGGESGGETGTDFASTVGAGGVLGTKFTWPGEQEDAKTRRRSVRLTAEREAHWRKWIGLYKSRLLSSGDFRNLYTTGFDNPEGYAIEKDGAMYYAFYSDPHGSEWKGEIELRGLRPGRYSVFDYGNDKDLGGIEAANPRMNVTFTGHLLLQVSPKTPNAPGEGRR